MVPGGERYGHGSLERTIQVERPPLVQPSLQGERAGWTLNGRHHAADFIILKAGFVAHIEG